MKQKNQMKEQGNLNVLLFASVGYYIKGVDTAIKGTRMARDEYGLRINLIIALKSEQKDILKQIADECDGTIPDWIIPVSVRQDVASLYHLADVYLCASRSEGFCYSIVESVYCGCQVIQSDIPQNPRDIPGTYVFKCADPVSLKYSIIKLAEDMKSDSYTDLQKAQREYVIATYNIYKWTSSCYNILSMVYENRYNRETI